MKFAAFSDLHITNKNSKFRTNKDGVSDLLIAQYEFVDWMCEQVEADDEVCGLFFLGDWTDYSTLDPITATYSCRILDRLRRTGKHLVLIEGNHSTADKGNRFSVLGSLRELVGDADGIHLVTGFESIQMEDVTLHCFPYFSDYEGLEAKIAETNEKLDPNEAHVMLFHFPCTNAILDNGINSMKGVALTEDITCNFSLVLGGDFHRPQKLDANSKAFYVGAPFELKFNEQSDEPRGYVVVDVDTTGYSLDRVANPFNYRMVSAPAAEIVEVRRNMDSPQRLIVKVKGELDPAVKEEMSNEGFYNFTHLAGKSTRKENPDVVIVEDAQDDLALVMNQLELYEATNQIKQKVLETFRVVTSIGD